MVAGKVMHAALWAQKSNFKGIAICKYALPTLLNVEPKVHTKL